jgi:hypothetical protein
MVKHFDLPATPVLYRSKFLSFSLQRDYYVLCHAVVPRSNQQFVDVVFESSYRIADFFTDLLLIWFDRVAQATVQAQEPRIFTALV